MFRTSFLYLSHAKLARRFITHFPLARRSASRFIAGDTPDDAIRIIRALNGRGIQATVDHLGENVASQKDAARAVDDYITILDCIHEAQVQSHASVKLTQLGLDLGEEECLGNLSCIVQHARARGAFVRVDMEGSAYTERTLHVVRRLKLEQKLENLGVAIQSYLYRSEQDVRALIAEGVRVRLCKGAYDEPPDRAYPRKADVDANYVRLARLLLDAVASEGSQENGLYPAFATHDARMIEAAKNYAAGRQIPAGAFEFQMLHGIRRDLQDALARQGYRVRVYVPYGGEWYPYVMRRLAERPANVWFFVANWLRP